ncbi:MAG TPA: CotH kinase family protein, partial [Phycisphaerae bacterium]|nr:CotH kinase family protein [Phycisphaerae bacterium]
FAAQGNYSSFNSSFRLVGDTANGGLSVAGLGGDVRTDVQPSMQNVNASLWMRIPFTVTNPAAISSLLMGMRYEDGFVAYLNGQEVARRNAPASVQWNSAAASDRPLAQSYAYEMIDLSASASLLQSGTNVLAIQGLNDSAADGDFLIVPTLVSSEGVIDPSTRRYFTTPTPGAYNNAGFPDFAGSVQCSRASGTFSTAFSVTLTTSSPTAAIRYTLDGTVPTETGGTLYTGPIAVSTTSQIRARAFDAGLAPGALLGRTYIKLDPAVQGFSSNLPIVIVDNFGLGAPNTDIRQPAFFALFDTTNNGRSLLSVDPAITSRAGITDRGSSTAGQPKRNLSVETRDEDDEDQDITPLGMPAESDWILYAPYYFDRALIRNAFVFELSNEMGRYAVRTRFVEVYANYNGGALTQSAYAGVYVFMEKIKRGPNRLDIEKLEPYQQTEPEVTGGWALKIDRADPGDVGFVGGNQTLRYVEPKEYEVTDPQAVWIKNYFDTFANNLYGSNFTDPINGYAQYIDPDAWVDHHILDVFSKNVDGLRLSTYMFKHRGGRIEMGPVWDYDRSMDSYDGRDDDANTWNGTGDATLFFNYPWWDRLFQDPDFWQRWIDRWAQLRTAQFSVSNMSSIIDGWASQLSEAAVRNAAAWPSVGPSGGVYLNETNHLKQWVTDRVNWIDTQFTTAPAFNHATGVIPYGFNLTLTAPAGTIYYTLNNSDPRMPGGAVSSSAVAYTTPLVLTTATHVRARALSNGAWSAPLDGQFILSFATSPQVVINEIMYNPAGAPNTEFVELHNLSTTEAVDMSGWRLNGVGLTFANGVILPPNAYGVVVGDASAFQAAYGSGILVLSSYTGSLDNGGETLTLFNAASAVMDVVTYDDDAPWPTSPDGTGPSLELIDATRDNNRVANWAASTNSGGTPGAPNSRAAALPPLPNLVINELLPINQTINHDEHNDFDPWIELYNPSDEMIDLGGMWLSDNYALPFKWQIPAGQSLCSGEWLLIWADNEPAEGALHANFRLSTTGGPLGLYSSGGLLLDYSNYPALSADIAFGRYPDGASAQHPLPHATPAAANANGGTKVILNEYNGVSPSNFLKSNGSDSFFGRILGNGGDWFELVVTTDHLDMRGWKLFITDNTGSGSQTNQTLTLTSHAIWSDLRSGTIITVSEDLADDVSYNPLAGDWWINVRANNAGTGTYITASNFSVSNDNWQLTIKDAQNNVVFGPAGEGIQPISGVGNDEVLRLDESPSPFIYPHSNYLDVASSTFGSPNTISSGGTQDFSTLRSVLQTCTDPLTCDDGDPCTIDNCVGGQCVHTTASPCYELHLNSPGSTGPNINACGGGTFLITLDSTGFLEPINGAQVLLNYDPTRLTLNQITPGDGAGSPWDAAQQVAFQDNNGAVVYSLILTGSGTTAAATIATLSFSVGVEPPNSPPTEVDFSPGCAPFLSKLTTQTNQTIRPTVVNSKPILTTSCLTATVSIPGLTGGVSEGATVATRDVEFIVTTCPNVHDTRTIPVTFHRSGNAGVGQALLSAVNSSASWLSIREGHTLRNRLAVDLSQGSAAVSTTLVSGDLHTSGTPQDGLIDIVDFAILAARWNTIVGDCTSGPPEDCSAGADVTGEGAQDTADFTALQFNFYLMSDAIDACGPAAVGDPTGRKPGKPGVNGDGTILPVARPLPQSRIGVRELSARLPQASRVDFNGDGVIDAADIREFSRRNRLSLSPAFEHKLIELEAASSTTAAGGKQ